MLLLASNQTTTRVPRKSFQILLQKTLTLIKRDAEGIVEVVFVSTKKIQELNKKYRERNKVTDVLSFEYPQEKENSEFFGQIIIAPEKARQQKDSKVSLKQELNKLFVHGLLHLFGFNHETDEEFYTMNKIEKRILQANS